MVRLLFLVPLLALTLKMFCHPIQQTILIRYYLVTLSLTFLDTQILLLLMEILQALLETARHLLLPTQVLEVLLTKMRLLLPPLL